MKTKEKQFKQAPSFGKAVDKQHFLPPGIGHMQGHTKRPQHHSQV